MNSAGVIWITTRKIAVGSTLLRLEFPGVRLPQVVLVLLIKPLERGVLGGDCLPQWRMGQIVVEDGRHDLRIEPEAGVTHGKEGVVEHSHRVIRKSGAR